ncbi:MAG: M23 family metallopeptidase [Coleofasciculaceae cyanobacterium RL_1_1]|nr:M23 family metallopeptidase [Coleofasciculaceae cyanobacterium RL_1_1]
MQLTRKQPIYWLLAVSLLLVSWLLPIDTAIAQDTLPRAAEPLEMEVAIESMTFQDLGAFDVGGAIDSGWDSVAGYAVGRSWEAGARPEDVLRLGDIADGFGAEKLTLQQVGSAIGQDLTQARLSDFELLADQSLESLSESVASLSEFRVGDIEPVDRLLQDVAGVDFGDRSLGDVVEIPDYGELKLSDLGGMLDRFGIDDIPNADLTRFDSLENFADAEISDIPGLDALPFSAFPNGIGSLDGIVARIDSIYSPAEDRRNNTISGSLQAGFSVPCSGGGRLVRPPDKCAYIEMDDLEDVGREVQGDFEGKQWISGKYHEVEGGFGSLRTMPSPIGYSPGYEPTGRHPFGNAFKVVVWEPDETTDAVSFKLTFRWCATNPVEGRTCTPYNQFAVPFVSQSINSLVYVGALDGEGGQSTAPPGASSYGGTSFGNPTLSGNGGICTGQTIDGINLDALGDSLAAIESRGSGNYQAVGVHTCPSVCGRALGRYQMMTYLPEVQSRVGAQPGGRQWLSRIENGYRPSQAEVQQYFPPEMQEEAFQDEVGQLFDAARAEIDPQTGQPFEGERIVERVAQMWFGGAGAPIDGGSSDALGRLSLYDYGVEARQHYVSQGGSPSTNCAAASAAARGDGVANGSYIHPVLSGSAPVTSGFGRRNIGCNRSKFHPAIDLGISIGTPIGAVDGGIVEFSSCNVSGYGCTIVIDHGDGRTTRYSHLANVGVQPGQPVSQGQQIAQSGNTDGNTNVSTGAHLDFGVYIDAPSGMGQLPASQYAIDPAQVIDFY